jgi:hypothetical protein
MPEYISICLWSARMICSSGLEFTCVTPENVRTFLPPGTIHENYLKLQQPALRADCIRAALLARYGGWWWDADTVGINYPSKSIVNPESALYMIWDKAPRRILNGYIYIPPDATIAKMWLGTVNGALMDDYEHIDWCSLGEGVLTNLLPELGAMQIDRSTFLPIDIDSSVGLFFGEEDFHKYLTHHTVCFGLNHSWFMYHRAEAMNLPSSEWSKSPLLIHKLLEHARRLL